MQRFVAFLRGMNLGRRRITNEDLRAHVGALGFCEVSAILASGNVLFAAHEGTAPQIARRLETGLLEALHYAVPTFVRSAAQVVAIADHEPFDVEVGEGGGKLQVALLARRPTAAVRRDALAHATKADRLEIRGSELYWLPRGKLTESGLDVRSLEKTVGPLTVRTRRTIERIAARLTAG